MTKPYTPAITPDPAALFGIPQGLARVPQGAQYTANTATTAATPTAASVIGAQFTVLDMTGTLGAGVALTMPTVAVLLAADTNAFDGKSYKLRVINTSSANFAWTVSTATGWTLTGTMSIAQNTYRDFVVTITSVGAATATCQACGVGTQS